jgi:hypothetical protein
VSGAMGFGLVCEIVMLWKLFPFLHHSLVETRYDPGCVDQMMTIFKWFVVMCVGGCMFGIVLGLSTLSYLKREMPD